MQTQTLVLVKQRNHLETVLVNEPVVVNRGHQIVYVKPQGVNKGLVTGKVLSRMVQEGKAPDFVVCMGEDRSDEKMFESITTTLSAQSSHAKYFLDEVSDLVKLLQGLDNTWNPKPSPWQTLGPVDTAVYGVPSSGLTRRQVLEQYQVYGDAVLGTHGNGRPDVRDLVKPLLNIFHSENGNSLWKRRADAAFRECRVDGWIIAGRKLEGDLPICVSPESGEEDV